MVEPANDALQAVWAKFDICAKAVRYAWVFHLAAGLIVLVAGSLLADQGVGLPIFAAIAKAGSWLFPLLAAASNCSYVGVLSQAVGATVFFTGHVLIVAYVVKLWYAAQLPDEVDSKQSGYAQLLFWAPMSTVVGCAMYWVTYVEMANASHIICASNATRVWLFRLTPTVATPFVVGLALAPIFTAVHFSITKLKNLQGVK